MTTSNVNPYMELMCSKCYTYHNILKSEYMDLPYICHTCTTTGDGLPKNIEENHHEHQAE